jgi:hypothetical protein
MLGQAKPYFTLIAESENREEVERAAASYKQKNPQADVVIDSWRDHIHHIDYKPIWRARARVVEERSFLQKLFDAGRR